MHIGEQFGGNFNTISGRRLAISAQLGVEHAAVQLPFPATATKRTPRVVRDVYDEHGRWSSSSLRNLVSYFARYGISVDAVHLELDQLHYDLATGLDRERSEGVLRRAKHNITAAADAGIPGIKYHLQVAGIQRTGWTAGRGGARYSAFSLESASEDSLRQNTVATNGPGPFEAAVNSTQSWSAIEHLVGVLLPVAEKAGIYMACHPQDPALPTSGLRGIVHVLGSIDGLKRFVSLSSSRFHTLNFCQGTVAEMCMDPAIEVIEAIEYFGSRRKMFMVHFRNILGGFADFTEVYPDNGVVDMHSAMRAYRAAGFEGMFVPDHAPRSGVDPLLERQFAFALGYTQALIQSTARQQQP